MDVSEQDYRLRRGPRQHKCVGFGVDPAAQSALISAKQWGAATGDEVAIGVHAVYPLPMGIGW